MKSRKLFISFAITLPAAFALSILACYLTPASYLYCLTREKAWLSSQNQEELENRLIAFYSKRQIEPTESDWGNGYELKTDEKMIRYLIFGREPLDVVYSKEGRIIEAFTSYE